MSTVFVSFCEQICEQNRYIVFFAETADMPNAVVDKILSSHSFCITVPVNSATGVSKNLTQLIAHGKIEVSLSFNPEPNFSALFMLSNIDSKRLGRRSIFKEYISNNLTDFKNNTTKNKFGAFLNHASISYDILCCFAKLGLSWVNMDNFGNNVGGVYYFEGITTFCLYMDFPYDKEDIVKWVQSNQENIIPVLLTRKHLRDVELMGYLINVLDNSKYIKPVTPMYIVDTKANLIKQKPQKFKQFSCNEYVMKKLYSTANLINDYVNASNFKESTYNDARNELIYLCCNQLLEDACANKSEGKRRFDTIYDNICRLLGETRCENETSVSAGVPNQHTTVDPIENGISICNEGLLKSVQVVSKSDVISISFSFEEGTWNKNISFIDFYIGLNDIEGAGSTSFLIGINGFLTTKSGWEYALRVYEDKAILYKYSSDGASFVSNLSVEKCAVSISKKYIRGNPVNWGYQAIVVSDSCDKKIIVDFFNQSTKTKDKILSIKPFQVSAVRCENS
ncbi:MAG: hypothetical protein LBU29_03095 [Endomicrobium sp.]|jgi:hypothetical protein|nr:hypothetical protein [Endomicrobium sp.]